MLTQVIPFRSFLLMAITANLQMPLISNYNKSSGIQAKGQTTLNSDWQQNYNKNPRNQKDMKELSLFCLVLFCFSDNVDNCHNKSWTHLHSHVYSNCPS